MTICIVGNGIIGMMTAYMLSHQSQDARIVVIGTRSRPGSASLAAAAMFNSFCELETGSLDNPIEHRRFLFNKSANPLWPDLLKRIAEESGGPLHYGFGTYLVRNTATDDLEDENFDAICAALKIFDEPHHHVSAADIAHYKPSASKRMADAVFIPREGWVNPIHLILALERILEKRGNVRLVDAECERIELGNNAVVAAALTGGERIACEQMLVCNGASFTTLMERSGIAERFQRIFYGVGATVVLECGDNAVRNCIRTPNRGLACGLYSAPQTVTEVVVGASNFISPVPEKEARITSVYSLLKQAMEQLNTDYYRARLVRVNVGWRPTSSDTLPLIGPTSVQGLMVATGTKRDGLHCSPVIAGYVADMLLRGVSDVDVELYKPERPLTRLYSRETAVNKYVLHTINSLYQHDFNPSKNRLTEELAQYYRQEFEDLHDRVGAREWGIPVEMKDMYRYGHIV